MGTRFSVVDVEYYYRNDNGKTDEEHREQQVFT